MGAAVWASSCASVPINGCASVGALAFSILAERLFFFLFWLQQMHMRQHSAMIAMPMAMRNQVYHGNDCPVALFNSVATFSLLVHLTGPLVAFSLTMLSSEPSPWSQQYPPSL
eukprot:CAMPEP_0197622126 /NCGR_PEP_ID=MMETSP1338-20131121/2517_1 /TAXON_ID=43686 ORGANISM="Pelagodinium beii, Strain RCC1491" /NCGR_SAMPLE_ID=MMETSP1338 /ASSEMBLY_ACC=CAM_ASM_000754 /LENGTH=112 /DNA_ID=CAMNT_0043191779 /DNA_START=334 /DNA_END=672 /DNA_ORIENTATION=-